MKYSKKRGMRSNGNKIDSGSAKANRVKYKNSCTISREFRKRSNNSN